MGLSEPATSSEQGCQSSTLYEIQLAPFGLISTKCTENSNQASIRILVRGPGVRETSVFSDPTTNCLTELNVTGPKNNSYSREEGERKNSPASTPISKVPG